MLWFTPFVDCLCPLNDRASPRFAGLSPPNIGSTMLLPADSNIRSVSAAVAESESSNGPDDLGGRFEPFSFLLAGKGTFARACSAFLALGRGRRSLLRSESASLFFCNCCWIFSWLSSLGSLILSSLALAWKLSRPMISSMDALLSGRF